MNKIKKLKIKYNIYQDIKKENSRYGKGHPKYNTFKPLINIILDILILLSPFLLVSILIFFYLNNDTNQKKKSVKNETYINKIYYYQNILETTLNIKVYIGWNGTLSNDVANYVPDDIVLFGKRYNYKIKNLIQKYDYIVLRKILYKYQNENWYKKILNELYFSDKKIYYYIDLSEKNDGKSLSKLKEILTNININVIFIKNE